MGRRVTDADHRIRVAKGALANAIPTNVDCPAHCKFCYEAKVSELVPGITTVFRPMYKDDTFAQYQAMQEQVAQQKDRLFQAREAAVTTDGETPVRDRGLAAFEKTENGVTYYPNCDYFSLGLKNEQIEQMVKNKQDDALWLYTTGLRVDPEFVAYLFRKYPDRVRFHLSIVSFDPQIRKDMMHPGIRPETLEEICAACKEPRMFVLYFNHEQVLADLEITDRYARERGGETYLHKLYYNRLEDPCVVHYSRAAEKTFESAVDLLLARPNPSDMVCSPEPAIYAHRWRHEIRELLDARRGTDDEVILCSEAAFPVIDRVFEDEGTRVAPVPSIFGGNVNFTQGITARAVIDTLGEILEEAPDLRTAYLPSSAFFIEQKYDLNGETPDVIRAAYPQVEVIVIEVPERILMSTVSIDTCRRYYDAGYDVPTNLATGRHDFVTA